MDEDQVATAETAPSPAPENPEEVEEDEPIVNKSPTAGPLCDAW